MTPLGELHARFDQRGQRYYMRGFRRSARPRLRFSTVMLALAWLVCAALYAGAMLR